MALHFSLRAVLLPVAASVALSACGPKVADGVAAAERRIAQGDTAGAEVALKSLIQKFPKSAEARFLLGKQLLRKGDAPAALVELERAAGLKFDNNQIAPLRARAMVLTGKSRQVLDLYSDAQLSDRAAQGELTAVVAVSLARHGSLDKAQALVDRTLKEQPDHPALQLVKAQLVAAKGDLPQALRLVEAVVAKHANNEEAWAIQGDLLLSQPDGRQMAIEAYRKSLGVNPNHLHARVALTTQLLANQELAAAETELALLRKAVPNQISVGFLEAQLAMAKKEPAKARVVFQSLLKALPDHPLVLQGAAATELSLNALEQAETFASKALTLAPNSTFARRILGKTLLNKGQPDKAAKVLAPLVDRADASASDLALAAAAESLDGDARSADALLQRLAKSKPTDPRLRTLLAAYSIQRNGSDAAMEQLQGISADDGGIVADLVLLNTQLKTSKLDDALKTVGAIARKQPDRPLADLLKAQVLERRGDRAEAQKSLDAALAKDPKYLPAIASLARLDLADNNPAAAKQRYQNLLKLQPNNSSALLAMAELSRRTGGTEATVRGFLDKAILADPQSLAVRQAVIEQHMSQGDQRAALNTANAAATAIPANVSVLERLAQVQLRAGELDQALSSYGKIAAMQPSGVDGPLGLARVHLARNDAAQARREAERVLEREPHHPEATHLLISAHVRQSQFGPALKVARAFKDAAPAQALGYQMEADIESAQGHWEAAAALLATAITKNAPGTTNLKLHRALVRAGKAAEAQAFEASWLKRHPTDASFMFYLGDQAQIAGQTEAAERRYRELLAIEPGHALGLNNLATLLVRQKRDGAQALIDKALIARPNDPAFLDTQAEVHAAAEQWDKAVDAQTRAVAQAPKSFDLRLRLARYQAEAGKKREAAAELGKLANAGLPLTDAQKNLVRQAQADLRR